MACSESARLGILAATSQVGIGRMGVIHARRSPHSHESSRFDKKAVRDALESVIRVCSDPIRRTLAQSFQLCFVLFAIAALSGCGQPLAGAYRITVTATVEGEPVKIDAVVQCTMTRGLETEDPEVVGKRLPNGHVVYVVTAVQQTCNVARGMRGIERAVKLLPQGTPLMFWSAGGGALAPAEAYLGPSAFLEPNARIRDVTATLSPASLWEARWWLFWAVRTPNVVVPPDDDRWREIGSRVYGTRVDDQIGLEPHLVCSGAILLPLESFAGTPVGAWAQQQRTDDLVAVPAQLRSEAGFSLVGAKTPNIVGLARGFPGYDDLPLLRGSGAFASPADWSQMERFLSTVYPITYLENDGVRTARVSNFASQIVPCEELPWLGSFKLSIGNRSLNLSGKSASAELILDRRSKGFWVYYPAMEVRLGWRPAVPAVLAAKGRESEWILERRQ
jgi:hypothetical protein